MTQPPPQPGPGAQPQQGPGPQQQHPHRPGGQQPGTQQPGPQQPGPLQAGPQQPRQPGGQHSPQDASAPGTSGSAARSAPAPGDRFAPPRQTHAGPPPQALALTEEDQRLRDLLLAVRRETAKAVVGQDEAVEGILIGLLVQGHVLLEGVPGVAKTLLVRSIAQALALDSQRMQFTPDLMPGDVTGSLVYDAKSGDFAFREGPVFTHLMIADEINRTPPKTQSALLEAMEERQVSTDGVTRALPQPFLVAATQNPVEHEGTYPLPEAQLDRFLFKLVLDLPDRETEFAILTRHARGFDARRLHEVGIERVAGPQELLAAGQRVSRVHCAPEVLAYIVDIVQATRRAPSLSLGVSPRGATRLLGAAQARAWLSGRGFVTPDDVKSLVPMTFRHRVTLRPEAQMEGAAVDRVLDSILETVAVPR